MPRPGRGQVPPHRGWHCGSNKGLYLGEDQAAVFTDPTNVFPETPTATVPPLAVICWLLLEVIMGLGS